MPPRTPYAPALLTRLANAGAAVSPRTHAPIRPQYHIAVSTKEGVTIGEAESAETSWDIADLVKGYE